MKMLGHCNLLLKFNVNNCNSNYLHAFIVNLNLSILIALIVFSSLPEFEKTYMVQNFCLKKTCIKLNNILLDF